MIEESYPTLWQLIAGHFHEAPIVAELVDVLPDTAEYIESGTIWNVGGRRSVPWFVKKPDR